MYIHNNSQSYTPFKQGAFSSNAVLPDNVPFPFSLYTKNPFHKGFSESNLVKILLLLENNNQFRPHVCPCHDSANLWPDLIIRIMNGAKRIFTRCEVSPRLSRVDNVSIRWFLVHTSAVTWERAVSPRPLGCSMAAQLISRSSPECRLCTWAATDEMASSRVTSRDRVSSLKK